ncbi:MAG: class I SAM-dependent methyltransferase [Desulfohalobiaceae bacterium]
MTEPQISQIKQDLAQEKACNQSRLNQSLSFWQSWMACWGILWAQVFKDSDHPGLDPEAIQLANQEYDRHFALDLVHNTKLALAASREYWQRIKAYEQCIGHRPCLPFPAHSQWYALLTQEPLRIQEELFILEQALEHISCQPSKVCVLDIGTGQGRILHKIQDKLSRAVTGSRLQCLGLDREIENLRSAIDSPCKQERNYDCRWLAGDMTALPLQDGCCDLLVAASCLYLVPQYERPLALLEMLRCLRQGGDMIITGPNQNFSAAGYMKCAMASNPERLFWPWTLAQLQDMCRVGISLDDLMHMRSDSGYLQIRPICELLQTMDCSLICQEHWPHAMREQSLFSGIRFRTGPRTPEYIRQYQQQ